MESEDILDPQFTGSWSTCSSIPIKQFLINSTKAISYQLPIKQFLINVTRMPFENLLRLHQAVRMMLQAA